MAFEIIPIFMVHQRILSIMSTYFKNTTVSSNNLLNRSPVFRTAGSSRTESGTGRLVRSSLSSASCGLPTGTRTDNRECTTILCGLHCFEGIRQS